jgi:3-oxosteroid 1-dehydrogenase
LLTSQGNTFRIKAKKGVIFATGGFSRNSEYLERFIGGPLYTQGCANPNAQGDFLRMALEIGGINVENLQEGWLLETSLEKYIQYNALGKIHKQF